MADQHTITFEGLAAPVLLKDAEPVARVLREVARAAGLRETEAAGATPFATISAQGDKWRIEIADDPAPPRFWDAVDVVCDLLVEVAWERLRSNPEWLCLHAAGVQFGDRMVVFPNARRAGKSTLAVALACMGRRLWSDDVVPLERDVSGWVQCVATGIAPRLRLPLPSGVDETFRHAVAKDSGPANRQYKYLTDLDIPHAGDRLPLGAVVILDRQDEAARAQLDRIDRATALNALIRQNFSRDHHAGRILRSLDLVTGSVPLFRLRYSDVADAAALLHGAKALADLPAARSADLPDGPRATGKNNSPFDPAAVYRQAEGLVQTEAGHTVFLADAMGAGIHELNSGSAMIWSILSEPETAEGVAQVLLAAFPDQDKETVRRDCLRSLTDFWAAGIISRDD